MMYFLFQFRQSGKTGFQRLRFLSRWSFLGVAFHHFRSRWWREIHALSDALQDAHATAIYLRIATPTGTIQTSSLRAKTRVAPVKVMTIQILELNGALFTTRLCSYVNQAMKHRIERTILLDRQLSCSH